MLQNVIVIVAPLKLKMSCKSIIRFIYWFDWYAWRYVHIDIDIVYNI